MTFKSVNAIALGESIASIPLFAGVEPTLLQGAIASGRISQHEKGDVFLTQGQPLTRFYVVLEGWCGASRSNAEGQECILQIFSHGDFLPEPDKTDLKTSPMNLLALTPLRLLMLSPSIVQNLLDRSSVFKDNMLAASVRRCHDLRDHIEQLTLCNAEQRVGRFLLQVRLHMDVDPDCDILLPFDKSLIASYLGMKPETFSRTLQAFKEKGFVVDRNHLISPNHKVLCDYCDSSLLKSCRHAHTDECAHADASAHDA